MKISNLVFNIFTGVMEDTLSNRGSIEADLKKVLVGFRYTNVPAEAPANLPRLLATSQDGLFNILITNRNIQFEYVNNEDRTNEEIFNSLKNLVNIVGSYFENYIDREFNYSGLTIKSVISRDEVKKHPVNFLKETFGSVDTELPIDTISYKICFTQNEYYINYNVSNGKELKVFAPNEDTKPTKIESGEESIIFDLDVNDRYGYMYNESYKPEIEETLKLIEDVEKFYNERAMEVVLTNKFDYFC